MAASSVRGAALWSMGGQYIVFAVQFAVSVVISRFFLTPAEVGLFSIALAAAMMVSILQDFGITRYVAGEADLDERKIRGAYSVSIVFALMIGLVILALAWPVARFYGDARLLPLLCVIAGSYLLVPFGIVPSALLQREMDFRSLFWVNVGAASANAVVAISLAAAGWSAMALAWAAVAQQGVRALIGMGLSGWRSPFPIRLRGTRPVLRFGSGMSALYVSGAIGTRSPELVIGRLIDFAAVGLYGRAMGLAGQLQTLVAGAIGGVFYPAFARIRDRGEDMAPPYMRVVSGYTATVWPAMAFLAAASTPLVLILFGPKWAGVAPLLVWIALSEFAFTALPLHMEIPVLMGRMRKLLGLNILDTVASLSLLLVGAWFSLEGAALSRIAYGAAWFLIYAGFMRRLIGFGWGGMAAIYWKSALLSLATAGPLLAVYAFGPPPAEVGFLTLAACGAAGCLAWLAGLFIVRHPARHEALGMIAMLGGAARMPLRRGA